VLSQIRKDINMRQDQVSRQAWLRAGAATVATPALAAGCQYILGFKTLHADLGLTVANCLDDPDVRRQR